MLDPERSKDYLAGVITVITSFVLLVGLFVFAVSDFFGAPTVLIRAHFREISGLGENSKVNLGGKPVGRVEEVTFVEPRYTCNPATEDTGIRETHTDDCEPGLFCTSAPSTSESGTDASTGGLCAELLPFSGRDQDYADQRCYQGQGCDAGETCVNEEFRERYVSIHWPGPEPVCVTHTSEHRRVEVRMAVDAEKLAYVRSDSLATVASSGVLGDSVVNITVGSDAPIEDGGLIRSGPSLFEELAAFRDRFAAMGARLRRAFGDVGTPKSSRAMPDFGSPQEVERKIAQLRQTTDNIIAGRGSMGRLFSDEDYRRQFPQQLADLRQAAADFEHDLHAFERKTSPKIRKFSEGAAKVERKINDLRNPESEDPLARAFSDPRLGEDVALAVEGFGPKAKKFEGRIDDVRDGVKALHEDLREGNGLFHELLASPDLYYKLVKALGNTERNEVMKRLVRDSIQQDDRAKAKRGE